MSIKNSDADSGWVGWAFAGFAHPEFGVSVNPFPTRGTDYAYSNTACPPEFENLMPSLKRTLFVNIEVENKCAFKSIFNLNIFTIALCFRKPEISKLLPLIHM